MRWHGFNDGLCFKSYVQRIRFSDYSGFAVGITICSFNHSQPYSIENGSNNGFGLLNFHSLSRNMCFHPPSKIYTYIQKFMRWVCDREAEEMKREGKNWSTTLINATPSSCVIKISQSSSFAWIEIYFSWLRSLWAHFICGGFCWIGILYLSVCSHTGY